jgi:hypothetical protein
MFLGGRWGCSRIGGTMNVTLRAAALLLFAGTTLTACGTSEAAPKPTVTFTKLGQSQSPTPTPSPTSTRKLQADGGYYVNVYDLHHEVVAAGNTICKNNYEYWGAVAFADGTISCAKQAIMLNVFPSPEALEKNKAKEIEIGNVQSYDFTTQWLQGKNWTVRATTEEMAKLKVKLGGEIVTFSYGPSHRK